MKTKRILLHSPVGSPAVELQWPLVKLREVEDHPKKSVLHRIFELVTKDFPEAHAALINISAGLDVESLASVEDAVKRFNKAMDSVATLWKGRAPRVSLHTYPARDILDFILQLSYMQSIQAPELLNKCYQAFSEETYGEVTFDFVCEILDQIKTDSDTLFLDLGSGVGQVVMQMAASGPCKMCIGIEKGEIPWRYCQEMDREFRKWISWFGKKHSPYKFIKADFLMDSLTSVINESNFIFANNFIFGPEVNNKLKGRFQSLRDGTKIVSAEAFTPMQFKVNARNLHDLGAITKVKIIEPKCEYPVSWTSSKVYFYLHTITRKKLEKYFKSLENKGQSVGEVSSEDETSNVSQTRPQAKADGGKSSPSLAAALPVIAEEAWCNTRGQVRIYMKTLEQSMREQAEASKVLTEKSFNGRRKSGSLCSPATTSKQSLRGMPASVEPSPEPSLYNTNGVTGSQKRRSSTPASAPPSKKINIKRTQSPLAQDTGRRRTKTEFAEVQNKWESVSASLDLFLADLKQQYLTLMKAAVTPDFCSELQVQLKQEEARRKRLRKETSQLEAEVENLREKFLSSFTSRLKEVKFVVNSPEDALECSLELSQQNSKLKNTVRLLEADIQRLKHHLEDQHMTSRNSLQPATVVAEAITDPANASGSDDVRESLCSRLLNLLQDRLKLLNSCHDLEKQIQTLEEPRSADAMQIDRPKTPVNKAKPVAFVSPTMTADGTPTPANAPLEGVVTSGQDTQQVAESLISMAHGTFVQQSTVMSTVSMPRLSTGGSLSELSISGGFPSGMLLMDRALAVPDGHPDKATLPVCSPSQMLPHFAHIDQAALFHPLYSSGPLESRLPIKSTYPSPDLYKGFIQLPSPFEPPSFFGPPATPCGPVGLQPVLPYHPSVDLYHSSQHLFNPLLAQHSPVPGIFPMPGGPDGVNISSHGIGMQRGLRSPGMGSDFVSGAAGLFPRPGSSSGIPTSSDSLRPSFSVSRLSKSG